MIVVSDTSAITALLTVVKIEILRQLFNSVTIPPAVELELLRQHPQLPHWIRIEPVRDLNGVQSYLGKIDRVKRRRSN